MVYKSVALRRETYEKLERLGTAADSLGDVIDKLIEKCGDKI